MDPAKYTFGAIFEKLLRFIVGEKVIEVDPDKVRVIQEMLEPQMEKEVKSFLGRLNYTAYFISQLTTTYELIFCLLRKSYSREWDKIC